MGKPTTLRCLGRPALLDENGTPVRLRTQKQLALLIYMIMEARAPIRRERLTELLWPAVGLTDARRSIGTALWGLRNRLGPKAFPGDAYTIRTTVQLDCDLDRLQRGDVLATEFLPALEVDAFLEDFDIPDAPGFNHWRDQQRARLWPSIEAALVRQMDYCRRTGDFTGIEPLAERTLRHNPLSEAAIRARIEARAFAGDRIGALKAFETWKQELHTELQAQPSEPMEAMARRLRRGTLEGGGDGTRPRVPTEQWRDRTFVGRSAEYRLLYEAWERSTRGQPTHALVLGESGIGKSTLLQRLMTAASLDGAVTSRVQCYELEREIPYAALGALVRGLLERPEALATSPQSLADLAQAVPSLREQFPNLPPSLQLQGESFRIRVTDAMEALLRAIAEEAAVMIVVDDFHMADDASLSVIHLLAHRFEAGRVMIALAARPGGANESPNLAKIRESHRRLGFVSLEVPPMAPEEAAELLKLLTAEGPDPGKTVRDAMLRAAGGYPMALELFVSEWIGSGEDSLALAVPAMREELGKRLPPADAYRMALDRICEGLDAQARLVLQLASVLGARLNDFSMYQIVSLGIGTTGQAMEALRSARLLRETEERLEFVNELTRGHAYLGIPKPMRTALHKEVVTRLLQTESEGGRVPGLEIAWHLIRAGRLDEATPYLLRGARESMRGGAPHEAERGLATALDRLSEPDTSEARLLIGEALQEQGRMQESVGLLDAVSGEAPPSILSRTRVLRLYAARFVTEHHPGADRQALLHLLAEASDSIDTNTRLRALWIAASICRNGPYADFADEIWRMLSLENPHAMRLEDRAEHALGIAYCQYSAGQKRTSRSTIESIIGELERQGVSNSIYLSLLHGLGANHIALGEYEKSIQVQEEGVRVARRIGDDRRLRMMAGNIALSHLRSGAANRALEWVDYAMSITAPCCGLFEHYQFNSTRGRAHAMLGNTEAALSAIEEGRHRDGLFGPRYLDQAWKLWTADVFQLVGRSREATQEGRAAVTGEYESLRFDTLAGPYARWLVRSVVGEPSRLPNVRECLKSLERKEAVLDLVDQAEVLNARTWLEASLGQVNEADREEMWRRLRDLPIGVTNELKAMGMLDF